jgi:hypothetical protein
MMQATCLNGLKAFVTTNGTDTLEDLPNQIVKETFCLEKRKNDLGYHSVVSTMFTNTDPSVSMIEYIRKKIKDSQQHNKSRAVFIWPDFAQDPWHRAAVSEITSDNHEDNEEIVRIMNSTFPAHQVKRVESLYNKRKAEMEKMPLSRYLHLSILAIRAGEFASAWTHFGGHLKMTEQMYQMCAMASEYGTRMAIAYDISLKKHWYKTSQAREYDIASYALYPWDIERLQSLAPGAVLTRNPHNWHLNKGKPQWHQESKGPKVIKPMAKKGGSKRQGKNPSSNSGKPVKWKGKSESDWSSGQKNKSQNKKGMNPRGTKEGKGVPPDVKLYKKKINES